MNVVCIILVICFYLAPVNVGGDEGNSRDYKDVQELFRQYGIPGLTGYHEAERIIRVQRVLLFSGYGFHSLTFIHRSDKRATILIEVGSYQEKVETILTRRLVVDLSETQCKTFVSIWNQYWPFKGEEHQDEEFTEHTSFGVQESVLNGAYSRITVKRSSGFGANWFAWWDKLEEEFPDELKKSF